jgi:hypothetical protein
MPELRSLAIEPARAIWHDWLSTAQRLRQLTHGHADACEHLIASLQRWPSFAAADPWAINAQMLAGASALEDQSPAKRQRSLRETLPPQAAVHPTLSRPARPAAASRLPRGLLSTQAPTAQPSSALTTRAPSERALTESTGTAPADAQVRGTALDVTPSAGSLIAALVAETIGRHVTGTPADGSTISHSLLSDLLPDSSEPETAAKATTTSPYAAPGESRPALQAVDLPMRAALERIAQAEAPSPTATLLAPASDLLQRLLSTGTAAPVTAREPEVAGTPRLAAPRAPSRLLTAPGASTAIHTAGPRLGPSGGTPPEEDDEASADAISRLLADQAWLRGVDFT